MDKNYYSLINKCIYRESIAKILLFLWLTLFYIYQRTTNNSYDINSIVFFKSFLIPSFYIMCQFLSINYLKTKDKDLLPKYKIVSIPLGIFGLIGFIVSIFYLVFHS